MSATDWRELTDARTGRKYYGNIKTKETSWVMPEELKNLKKKKKDAAPPPPPPPPKQPPTVKPKAHAPAPPGDPNAQAKIAQLKRQLADLKVELDSEQKRTRLLELSTETMRKELIDAETERDKLKSASQSATQTASDIQKESMQAKEKLAEMEKRAKLAELQAQKVEDEKNRLEKDKQRLQQEIEQLQTNVSTLEAAQADSVRQGRQQELRLSGQEKEIRDLKSQNKELTNELKNLRHTMSQASSNDSQQIQNLKAENARLQAESSSVTTKMTLLQSTNTELKAENRRLKEQLASSQQAAAAAPAPAQDVVMPLPEKKVSPSKAKPLRSKTFVNLQNASLNKKHWQVLTHGDGREYYYNSKTGETTWNKPLALGGVQSDWKEVQDPSSGNKYYFNEKTQETTWTKPQQLVEAEQEAEEAARLAEAIADAETAKELEMEAQLAAPSLPPPTAAPVTASTSGPKSPSSAGGRGRTFKQLKIIEVHPPVRDPKRDLTPEDMQFHSMVNYAAKYFQPHKSGVFGKMSWDEMISHSLKLTTSLHKLEKDTEALEAIALQAFKNITSYMGDRKSSKVPWGHVQKLLANAFKNYENAIVGQLVRDEMIALVIKQTTGNPDKTSNNKGWALLAILLSLFPPSLHFQPFVKAHIRAAMHQVSDPSIAKWAVYCEDRLYQSIAKGPRRQLPTKDEVETISTREQIMMKIFFANGSQKTMAVQSQTTAADVCNAVCRELNMPVEGCPGIVGHRMWGLYHMDEMGFVKSGALNAVGDRQRLLDIRAMYYRTLEEHKVPETKWDIKFQFKAKLFFQELYANIPKDARNLLDMLYMQGRSDVLLSKYAVTDAQAIHLAALQIQAQIGDEDIPMSDLLADKNLSLMFPKAVVNKYQLKLDALRSHVIKDRSGLKGVTKDGAKREYLRILQALNYYGANFFPAKRLANRTVDDVVLGVSQRGVFFLHPITRMEVRKGIPLDQLVKFHQAEQDFEFVTKASTTTFKFKSKYADLIYNRISAYRQAALDLGPQ